VWSDPEIETVLPGVHRVPLPLPGDALKAVNVYLIEDADGYTLVDSGWDNATSWLALTDGLARAGADVREVRRVLVTHLHHDHVGQATALHREAGAQVWLGEGERRGYQDVLHDMAGVVKSQWEYLRRGGAAELVSKAESLVPVPPKIDWDPPQHWVADGVLLAGGIETISTPGHTQGHTSYFDRGRGVLFPGDHVLPHITPSIGFEPYPTHTALADFLHSLAKVRQLPARLVLPAHGPVFTDLAARVDELAAHHETRLAQCVAAIPVDGGCTAYEIAVQLPWTRRERRYDELNLFNKALAVWETLAHLELLDSRGDISCTEVDGVWRFRRKVGR
jgi:glyoxylase-like metal-dependent hydrolase (beta-lactamase superfamily II)